LFQALKVDHATIEDKQNRNARLEREVSKYKERRAIEKNVRRPASFVKRFVLFY